MSPSAAAPLLQEATATPTPDATPEPSEEPASEPEVALPTVEPITLYLTLEPEGQVAAVRYEVSAGDVLIAGILFAQLVVLLVSLGVSLAGRHAKR
ncbi:MAG: hypothetical protein JXN59_09700 [Anaerolineae bacterium]|nr:hypothetical protein [Anaerolineae bacterium]